MRPWFMLLDAGGNKLREWIGVLAESSLTTGLDDLLKRPRALGGIS